MKYTDRELLEVIASRLRSIAEDMQRLTTGNLAHNGCAIRGRLLRNAELIEKHLKQAQYIDKSTLVAEIERRKNYYENIQMIKPVYESNIEDFNELLSFLDVIEVKEVDFEREMQAFAKINLEPLVISDSNIGISITMSQLYNCAKHFFELGMAVSNKAQKGE